MRALTSILHFNTIYRHHQEHPENSAWIQQDQCWGQNWYRRKWFGLQFGLSHLFRRGIYVSFLNYRWSAFILMRGNSISVQIGFTWNIVITLESVQDGSLKISIGKPEFKVEGDGFKSSASGQWDFSHIEWSYDTLYASMISLQENFPIAEAQEAFDTDLADIGGGTFRYENPIFNNEGDLLVEASYQDWHSGAFEHLKNTAAVSCNRVFYL